MENQQAKERLIESVEAVAGRKMQTPKDFDFLSELIFDRLRQHISATTLKRLWGYLPETSAPRLSTLNLLSQFVGCESWEAFCETVPTASGSAGGPPATDAAGTDEKEPEQPLTAVHHRKSYRNILMIAVSGLMVALLACTFYIIRHSDQPTEQPDNDRYILKKGQRFNTPQEYLSLFGITNTDTIWGRPVPHHDRMWVWTPEYRNRHWHNYGDSAQLMPTITEHWEPDEYQASPEVIAYRNKDQYWHYFRRNEIRITFMKGLVDSAYVFLGVYRMSIEKSDTTRCVWERVIDECDLNNLDYLEQLRN